MLVVILDDLGWRDVSPHVGTPGLDRLAASGVTYARAYAMPVCSPSRYAALFGRYGRRDGVDSDYSDYVAPEAPSLAAVLREAGYATAAFGKWHLPGDPAEPGVVDALGFDAFRAGTRGNLGGSEGAHGAGSGYASWTRIDDGERTPTEAYATEVVRGAFLEWWRSEEGRPRFAWVAFHAAHQPLHAAPAALLPDGYPAPDTKRAEFESMVVALDTVVGELVEAVDLERTLVICVSDNGTPPKAAAEDQAAGRLKRSTFEGGVRVPLFVAGPGVRRGATSKALVHVVDLLGTVCELAGLEREADTGVDSRSFAADLTSPEAPAAREFVLCEWYQAKPGERASEDDVSIITASHKLRRVLRLEGYAQQLFDLESDPDERRPLPMKDASNRALRAALVELRQGLPPRR